MIIAKALSDHSGTYGLRYSPPAAPDSQTLPDTEARSGPDTEAPTTTDWETRLAAIEFRQPSKQFLGQIASANEARMATQIEHLQKPIDEIKSSMPRRGEATGSVLTALAAIAGIVAVITWVLTNITTG